MPRAHGIATFSLQGDWQGLVPLPEVCPLAVRGGALWAGGLVASLHAVELAQQCFERLVGIRGGRIVFDLPARQVTPVQLQALYAAEGLQASPPQDLPHTAAASTLAAVRRGC